MLKLSWLLQLWTRLKCDGLITIWFETWEWKYSSVEIWGWKYSRVETWGWKNSRVEISKEPILKSTFAIVDKTQMKWSTSHSGMKHEDEYFRVETQGWKYSRVEISKEPILKLSRLSPLWTRPKCDGLLHVFMTNIKTRIAVTTLGNVKNDSQCAVWQYGL